MLKRFTTWMTIGGTFYRRIWLRSVRTPTILAPVSGGLPSTIAIYLSVGAF
jgi:hypothetical protein